MAKDFLPVASAADQEKMARRKEKSDAKKMGLGGNVSASDAAPAGKTATGASASHGEPDAGALLADAQPKQQPTLSTEADSQIKALQDAWAKASAANDQAGMDAAHTEAEKIRAKAGYLGGADGTDYVPLIMGTGNKDENGAPRQQKSAIDGGYTADDIAQWLGAYDAANSNPYTYTNGFDSGMNDRSKANMIRQQMYANSQAWANADDTQKAYLNAQNQQLARELEKATGGVKSTFNAATGQWETDNGNLGYGVNTYWTNYFKNGGNTDGLTQEMADKFANDVSRYSNFVDQNARNRWFTDESSGYTGQYAEYVGGRPFGQRLAEGTLGMVNPATDHDLVDDGFNDAAYWNDKAPRDANGDLVQQAPVLKGNNNLNDYTASKAARVDEYGIIQPGVLNGTTSDTAHLNMWLNGGNPVENPGDNYGVTWGSTGRGFANAMGMGNAAHRQGAQARLEEAIAKQNGAGANSYEQQINAMYDADLNSKLSALESEYMNAIAELDKTMGQTDAQYDQSRRQTVGSAERDAAAWREMANAQGVNSGAIGQNALATSSQIQSNINAMNSAQASAQAQIETQRALLAQTYQLQIQQAEAENDYARAQALLQEAQRVDDALRAQEQQNASNALSYMQMMMGG